MLGCVALDGLEGDLQGGILGFFLGLLGDFLDDLAGLVLALAFDGLERLALGILLGEVGESEQGLFLFQAAGFEQFAALGDQGVELFLLAEELSFAFFDACVEFVEVFFLGGEGIELAVEVVLSLGEAALDFLDFVALLVDFFFEGFASFSQFVEAVEFSLFLERLSFAFGFFDQVLSLAFTLADGLDADEFGDDDGEDGADDGTDEDGQQPAASATAVGGLSYLCQ